MRRVHWGVWALALLISAVITAQARAAQSVADFYRGKTINLYIGFSSGGTYDTYARLVANFMGAHIPGRPTIVPMEMAGAGSRVAANYMYSVAAQDGTQLATIDQASPIQQLMREPGIRFDAAQFGWIGNPIKDNNTTAAWYTSGITSLDDAKKRVVIVGANGLTASALYPQAMNEVLGTKFKIITGYPGGTDVNLAMERGEVAVRGTNSWSSWKSQHQDWIDQGKLKFLVQVGLAKEPQLSNVPLLMDLPSSQVDRDAMRLLSAPTAIGRPIFTTPGVPADRLDALRAAFDETMRDPQFLNAAHQAKMDINPVDGVTLQTTVDGLFKSSPASVQRLIDILAPLQNR